MPSERRGNPARRVAGFLLFRCDLEHCDACLARALGLPLAEVRAAAERLARSPAFLRDRWRCVRCRDVGLVTRALPTPVLALKHRSRARLLAELGELEPRPARPTPEPA